MTSASLTQRRRQIVTLVALLVQSVQLWVFFPAAPKVEADNVRYEEGGYNLANNHRLSLSFSNLPDADVRTWACERHPDQCGPDDLYPTAAYPPGYQFFIAGIYSVFGRSIRALLLAQCLLHLLLVLLFESVAARLLGQAGYLFAMGIALSYPFLARQAGWVMSDHLHAVLLFASLWSVALLRKPTWRAAAFGVLFAFATLTRPYSFVCLPALLLLPAVRRQILPDRRTALAFSVAILVPFAGWTGRNAYVFGRFIPFTTTGIGASLYLNKTEVTIGSALDGDNSVRIYEELNRVAGNITTYAGDRRLRAAALDWLKDHWAEVVARLPARAARIWISLGMQGQGIHPQAILLLTYLGGLLLLGVVGLVLRTRDAVWSIMAVVVLCYWAFLLHTPAEARRSLALRLPMLLFAASAVEEAISRVRQRSVSNQSHHSLGNTSEGA